MHLFVVKLWAVGDAVALRLSVQIVFNCTSDVIIYDPSGTLIRDFILIVSEIWFYFLFIVFNILYLYVNKMCKKLTSN